MKIVEENENSFDTRLIGRYMKFTYIFNKNVISTVGDSSEVEGGAPVTTLAF